MPLQRVAQPGGTALDYVIATYPRDPRELTACIEMLLAAGARTRYDVPGILPILPRCRRNARADVDINGPGRQTPIFHALTHFKGMNPEVVELLIARGADLSIRARVPGHYERLGEVLDVSAAEYSATFPLR